MRREKTQIRKIRNAKEEITNTMEIHGINEASITLILKQDKDMSKKEN
jgi:hypothetical protein